MKTSPKNVLGLLVGGWLLLTLFRFLFYHEINDRFWILTWLFDGVLVVAGVVLAICLAWKKRRGPVIAAVLLLGMIALDWFSPAGRMTGTWFRMWRMESAYQEEVDRILALDEAALDSLRGNAEVDIGPPRRIAFSWGGIIDNWSGIVYDPSGDVLLARQFKDDWSNWGDPKLAEVRSLFGGDLRNATHLWGHWYYCVFT